MIGTRELHEPGGVRGGAARTTGHSLLFVHRRHAHGNARGDGGLLFERTGMS